MRFLLNFLFYGILFYLIWMFFPEGFKTLVSWADQIVAFFQGLFHVAAEKVRGTPVETVKPAALLQGIVSYWF